MNIKSIWIIHPRSKRPDAALTFAVMAIVITLVKFLLNGVTITFMNYAFNFGTIDSGLVGAILLPTLGAYVGRKVTDSPDKILESIGIQKEDN